MKSFDYSKIPDELLNAEIMNLISQIHEYKGKQELYIEAKPDVLNSMLKIAKIQSTYASNRIEGIYTSNKRLEDLVNEKTIPQTRSEKEIAGYRNVLELIHENYVHLKPRNGCKLEVL